MELKWRDLVILRPHEIMLDLLVWLPWLVLAWASALAGIWVVAVIGWFFFFLTGLRLSHEAFHRNLSLPVFVCNCVLLFLSPLMLSCLHATSFTHLQHHRNCLGDADIEGRAARLSAMKTICLGFKYPIHSHLFAWNSNDAQTIHWMKLELIWIISVYTFGIYLFTKLFLAHLIAMIVAESLASFFAVWMVHHDCKDLKNPSRSIRGSWRAYVTYNMFYHYEHHACPRVPTRHLPELAKRFDAAGIKNLPHAF